jgi:hypothetical protein
MIIEIDDIIIIKKIKILKWKYNENKVLSCLFGLYPPIYVVCRWFILHTQIHGLHTKGR